MCFFTIINWFFIFSTFHNLWLSYSQNMRKVNVLVFDRKYIYVNTSFFQRCPTHMYHRINTKKRVDIMFCKFSFWCSNPMILINNLMKIIIMWITPWRKSPVWIKIIMRINCVFIYSCLQPLVKHRSLKNHSRHIVKSRKILARCAEHAMSCEWHFNFWAAARSMHVVVRIKFFKIV